MGVGGGSFIIQIVSTRCPFELYHWYNFLHHHFSSATATTSSPNTDPKMEITFNQNLEEEEEEELLILLLLQNACEQANPSKPWKWLKTHFLNWEILGNPCRNTSKNLLPEPSSQLWIFGLSETSSHIWNFCLQKLLHTIRSFHPEKNHKSPKSKHE